MKFDGNISWIYFYENYKFSDKIYFTEIMIYF